MDKINLNLANAVSFKAQETEQAAKTQEAQGLKGFDAKLDKPLEQDKAELSGTKNPEKIAQRQDTLQKARAKAAGWSILFGVFDILYYALRSDRTVADRFDLDEDKDKKFIKQIKREQALWSIPGSIPTVGLLGGIVSYAYNKTLDSSKLKVEEN